MGRIKTKLMKRMTYELIAKHGEEFKEGFGDNKLIVTKYLDTSSKKIRNTIAGYTTRITRRHKIIE